MTTTISPLLRTVPLPGRGLGTLATATIPRGTRLIVDPPVLAATAREMLNEDVLCARIVAAYAALADNNNKNNQQQQQRVRGLAADPAVLARWTKIFEDEEAVRNGWGKEGAEDMDVLGVEEKAHVMAAWNTNCFGIESGGSGGWAAVVAPDAARLNHSCAPNAVFAWNDAVGAGGAITVHAIREIAEGEEVTIAYVDVVGNGERRRAGLREHYGFVCGCEACCASGGEEEGDSVRKRIEELSEWLRERGKERRGLREEDRSRAKALLKEGVELHQRAGMVGVHLADFFEAAASVTGERQHLEEELRIRTYCLGDDHPHVQRLKQRLSDI